MPTIPSRSALILTQTSTATLPEPSAHFTPIHNLIIRSIISLLQLPIVLLHIFRKILSDITLKINVGRFPPVVQRWPRLVGRLLFLRLSFQVWVRLSLVLCAKWSACILRYFAGVWWWWAFFEYKFSGYP
jgi:hypothetical protein